MLAWPNTSCHLFSVDLNDTNSILIHVDVNIDVDIDLEVDAVANLVIDVYLVSIGNTQGCISCGILVSGIGARGVNSEHMENMEMFSCSPT